MTNDIIFEVTNHLAKITLNREKALNAMSYDMFVALHAHLEKWAADDAIKAVLIRSNSEKAFCAGGDIRAIYENKHLTPESLSEYFRLEYRVNQIIKHYPKPYIALTHGITMGGGIGISLHASHRVTSDQLRWAMPETLIGFFPDIGATYYLSRLENEVGTYLALTGNSIDAETAVQLKLMDFMIPRDRFDAVENALLQVSSMNGEDEVTAILSAFSVPVNKDALPFSLNEINHCFRHNTIENIFAELKKLQAEWSSETITALEKRSPTSLKVALKQLRLAREKSIDDVLEMDLHIAREMLKNNDFYEGVRAAIIDKDKNPQWQPNTLSMISDETINPYFE